MRFIFTFAFIFSAAQLFADTSEKFGSWTVSTQTYQGNEGTVKSCTIISQPAEIYTNPVKSTKPEDIIIGIVENTFKDKNDAKQYRIQLLQTAKSKVKYFDSRSVGTLTFAPASLELPLNDNLKIGVGAFNLTKAEFADFKKQFASASDLVLNVDMKGNMMGKVIFSLRGSAKAISFFNRNC